MTFPVYSRGRTLLLLCSVLLFAAPLRAEMIILEIFLNQESRGEYFVQLGEDDAIYLQRADALALELPGAADTEGTEIDGETYVAVGELQPLESRYDERSLTLWLDIPAEQLPVRSIDLSREHHDDIYYPQDDSFFLNYALDLNAFDSFSPDSYDITGELGWRRGRGIFLTDAIYSDTPVDSSFARLQSRLIVDDRDRLQRWTFGDFQNEPTPFGASLSLGGISLVRRFRIDPYYIHYPAIGFEGVLTTPGEVEVYLDGFQVYRQDLPPGRFVLNDLTRFGGAGELTVVVRDIYGREERIDRPFYIDEQLLRRDEHEYSYQLGVLREDFGSESFAYGDAVASAFHRYGWRSNAAIELSGEAGRGLVMLAPRLLFTWDAIGLFDLALAASAGSDSSGFAGSISYRYRARRVAASLRLKMYSEEFANLATEDRTERPATEAGVRFNYGTVDFGSFALDLATVRQHEGEDRDLAAVSYNRRLTHTCSLHASVRHTRQLIDDTRIMLTLSYRPRTRPRMAFKVESYDGGNAQGVQWFKDPPVGEGYGYRVESERRKTETGTEHSLEHFWQYNARYGIGRATAQVRKGEDDTVLVHRLSASGGLACAGGRCEPTRPVRDSFAVVKVGDVAGVMVLNNGQEIGRTDENGEVFIPDFKSFYENQLRINDQDIPLERSVTTIQRYISPPYRSGSCIYFPASRFQPLTGFLHVRERGEELPLEFAAVTVTVAGHPVVIETGRGGEFYLDPSEARAAGADTPGGCADFDLATEKSSASAYEAIVGYNGKRYPFTLQVPQSDDFYLDLGTVVVNAEEQ